MHSTDFEPQKENLRQYISTDLLGVCFLARVTNISQHIYLQTN